MNWHLNWREWQIIAEELHQKCRGAFLDRITVPERPEFNPPYLRGDYYLHFKFPGEARGFSLWLSLRPNHTFLARLDRPRRASAAAPHPTWTLQAGQLLHGAKLLSVHCTPRDRVIHLDFGANGSLVFAMVPARPAAWLLDAQGMVLQTSLKDLSPIGHPWNWPAASAAPENPPVRYPVATPEFASERDQQIAQEGHELQRAQILSAARERIKKLSKLARIATEQLQDAQQENSTQNAAHTLLIHSHLNPRPKADAQGAWSFLLPDATGTELQISVPEKLGSAGRDAVCLARHYLEKARRLQRKRKENEKRLVDTQAMLTRIQTAVTSFEKTGDPSSLESLLGLSIRKAEPEIAKRIGSGAPGRGFLSQEGWTILVGRNKKENLELTLRFARGNDIWLHLRGRASCHAVIPVPPGKSVPLQTLLDAAQLVMHFTDGAARASRAEVDYTFRKNVKRIPKTDEVSYTQEKTLTIQPDPERMRRLLT